MDISELNNDKALHIADILAQLIKITLLFPGSYSSLKMLKGFDDESYLKSLNDEVKEKWKQGADVFIAFYEEKLKTLREDSEKSKDNLNKCVIEAATIALQIDSMIEYGIDKNVSYDGEQTGDKSQHDVSARINLNCLFDTHPDVFWQISHLNSDTNVKETGIWLNPKFGPNLIVIDQMLDKERSLGNRESLKHLNAGLTNTCFFEIKSTSVSIRNVLLRNPKNSDDTSIKIAFAPMLGSGENPFDLEDVLKKEKGFEKKAFRIKKIKNENDLIKRFEHDLLLAAEKRVDIFFAPEMLGTIKMIGENNDYARGLYSILYKNRKRNSRLDFPTIIFYPSLWNNRKNIVYVAHNTGRILGKVYKCVPFVDHTHGEEDLAKVRKPELLVIHIPGIACISVMICAQFLADDKKNFSDVLFRCLGVDLLLVPSYSSGERDFVNKLSRFQEYGVNVIWGDTCRAVRDIKCSKYDIDSGKECALKNSCSDSSRCSDGQIRNCVIGATFVAGTGQSFRFGEKAANKCGFRCSCEDACIFTIKIPFKTEWSKLKATKLDSDKVVEHIYKRTASSEVDNYERE